MKITKHFMWGGTFLVCIHEALNFKCWYETVCTGWQYTSLCSVSSYIGSSTLKWLQPLPFISFVVISDIFTYKILLNLQCWVTGAQPYYLCWLNWEENECITFSVTQNSLFANVYYLATSFNFKYSKSAWIHTFVSIRVLVQWPDDAVYLGRN
jgi:hypothetical protein